MKVPDAQGLVSLDFYSNLPAGTYDVYVRPYRHWLGRKQRIQWTQGVTPSFVLYNGDANGDNAVDTLDVQQIHAHLGMAGPDLASDLNRDGIVNEQDVQIVLNNFGLRGDR